MILAAGVDVAAGGGGKAVFSSHLRILEEKSETTVAGIWTRVRNVCSLRRWPLCYRRSTEVSVERWYLLSSAATW